MLIHLLTFFCLYKHKINEAVPKIALLIEKRAIRDLIRDIHWIFKTFFQEYLVELGLILSLIIFHLDIQMIVDHTSGTLLDLNAIHEINCPSHRSNVPAYLLGTNCDHQRAEFHLI